MIEVNNLHKSFIDKKNTVKALDGLSFTAKDGEITGILGPNGAGKTTCLRTLYGLLKADEGSVMVDGINVLDDALRRSIRPDRTRPTRLGTLAGPVRHCRRCLGNTVAGKKQQW